MGRDARAKKEENQRETVLKTPVYDKNNYPAQSPAPAIYAFFATVVKTTRFVVKASRFSQGIRAFVVRV